VLNDDGPRVQLPDFPRGEGAAMSSIAPTAWWIMLAGAGGITLLAAAFYLIGVGLREALDPRSGSVLR